MITYNPSSLDPEVVHGVIGYLGHICVAHNAKGVVEICLECFHGIMGFSYIPKEALPSFICTLCRVVNIEAHCCEAWRIMGNLMATHLGHSALYNLCQVMQSKENQVGNKTIFAFKAERKNYIRLKTILGDIFE
jgi:tuberous sclerosis protein 2